MSVKDIIFGGDIGGALDTNEKARQEMIQRGQEAAERLAATGRGENQQRINQEILGSYQNPYLDQNISAIQRAAQRRFQEQVAPGIQGQFANLGTLGSGRAAVAQGIAQRGLEENLQNIEASQRSDAYNRAYTAAINAGANEFQAQNAANQYLTGIGSQNAQGLSPSNLATILGLIGGENIKEGIGGIWDKIGDLIGGIGGGSRPPNYPRPVPGPYPMPGPQPIPGPRPIPSPYPPPGGGPEDPTPGWPPEDYPGEDYPFPPPGGGPEDPTPGWPPEDYPGEDYPFPGWGDPYPEYPIYDIGDDPFPGWGDPYPEYPIYDIGDDPFPGWDDLIGIESGPVLPPEWYDIGDDEWGNIIGDDDNNWGIDWELPDFNWDFSGWDWPDFDFGSWF